MDAGDVISGRYRLAEQVGQGGMGRVWRGRDEVLDRVVAVKEILLPDGISPQRRALLIERLRREARVAARLRHAGIVGVHDMVEHDGAPAIVMEFVTGRSLRARLEGGPLSVAETVELGAAVLDALGHAHAAGVVHRDLKPDNILLTETGPVIMDFGIARPLDHEVSLTRTGEVVGTPLFMSPEQIEGRPATPACDLWSLGATLFVAVEGRPPFFAETHTALCAAILTQSPAPIERAGPLAPLLQELLTKDPGRRADSSRAARVLSDLRQMTRVDQPEQAGAATYVATVAETQLAATRERPGRWPGRRAVLGLLGVPVAVAVVIAVIVATSDGGGPKRPAAASSTVPRPGSPTPSTTTSTDSPSVGTVPGLTTGGDWASAGITNPLTGGDSPPPAALCSEFNTAYGSFTKAMNSGARGDELRQISSLSVATGDMAIKLDYHYLKTLQDLAAFSEDLSTLNKDVTNNTSAVQSDYDKVRGDDQPIASDCG